MTVFYATNAAKVLGPTPSTPSPGFVHGTVRVFSDTFTMATQTTSDTIVIGLIPKGSVFLFGVLNATATMGGTATVAIGIAGTTGKYRAAAVYAAAAPEVFGVGAASGVAEAADRTVFITIAAASLPAAGTVSIDLFFSHN